MSTDVNCDRPFSSRVEALAGYGLLPADIAQALGIGEEALKAEYADELTDGHIKAHARVADSLFRKATGEGRESITAAIFWLKTRARWKETSIHEHAGEATSRSPSPMRRAISDGRGGGHMSAVFQDATGGLPLLSQPRNWQGGVDDAEPGTSG